MTSDFLPVLLATGLAAGVVASLLVPLLVRLVEPARLAPAGETPRLGGIALFGGVGLAGSIAVAAVWKQIAGVVPRHEFLGLVLGAALVFLVGVVDDVVGTQVWKKLLVQILAAWLVVRMGWAFTELRLPLVGEIELGVWGPIVSLVWIVGVTNAINLIDGLDGLAGGVAAIIAFSLLAWALAIGNRGTAILFAAVTGACLGFLWHNWEPARIYLGDSGSLTLGFLFGAVSLHSSLKAPAAVAILVPILALGLPVIDTLLVMLFRLARGRERGTVRRVARVFRADRSHLHHLLGYAVRRRGRLVAILYAVAVLFCVGALAVAFTGDLNWALGLLAFEFAVVLAMRRLGLAAGAERLAAEQREEARRLLAELGPADPPAPAAAEPAPGEVALSEES